MKHRLRDAQWERREFDLVAYILWMGIVMSREGHRPAQIPGGPDQLGHNPGIFLILAAAWDIIMPVSQRKMLNTLSLSERMNVYLSNQTVSSVRTRTLLCSSFYYQQLVQELRYTPFITSDQIRSVAQSCPTLCHPMNCSTPGLPVRHQLPEFTQTHVHRVSDAIQPSHPLSSPSPLAPNPSQHQSLFQRVNSSHEVAKVLEFQL